MAMQRLNLIRGNTALHLRASSFQAGGHPIEEHMVEVRLQVSRSRSRFHNRRQNPHSQNQPDVFCFHFPLSDLFSHQLRQVQVQHMLSLVGHPYHHDVEFWSRQVSSFALRAARDAVLEGHNGFLMDIGISIPMVDRHPPPVFAELVDETSILSSDWDFGESGGDGGEFGGVPAAESSVSTLETRNFEAHESTSACVICLEDFDAGVVVTAMPCSHKFHSTCLRQWLEQSHLCPLCRFPMPTGDS